MALKAIALFHTGVSEDMLLKNAEFKELRTKLLKEAAGFYTELEKLLAGQTDATSRKTLAEGYFQLAQLTAKIGDQQQALAVHRKALALRRELAAAPGADVGTRLDVARSLRWIGDLLVDMGDNAGELATVEEYRDLAERLEAEHPSDAVRFALAQSYERIADLLQATGKLEEALTPQHRALAILQKLADANPAVTDFQYGLAQNHRRVGDLLAKTGKPEEALTEYRRGLDLHQKLVDANPAVTDFQRGLAWNHRRVGDLLAQTGKLEEALTPRRQALAIFQKLADANPAVTEFQTGLAWSHHNVGGLLARMGKPEEAQTEYRKSLDLFQKLADANPAVIDFQRGLAWNRNTIGGLLSQTGKPEEALTEFRQALAIFQKLADANPADTMLQNVLSLTRRKLAWTVAVAGRPKEALPLLATAAAANPKDSLLSLELAALQAWFGQDKELAATLERMRAVAKDTKDAGTAERAAKACSILPSTSKAELDAALALARKGVELHTGEQWREWRLLVLGMAEYRSGHYAAADEALLAAAKAGPNSPQVTGIAAFYRAMSLFRQGKEAEARLLALAAVATMKPLPKDEQNPLADNATHDDLILWLAYKEAKAMLQFDEKKVERVP
jgi:serine/threonine-protein kinase